MANFDQQTGECLVFTYKEGLLSAVAHDLKIRVARWRLAYDGDAITASFDPTSLAVVCAMKNGAESPGTIAARDLKKIEASIENDVLMTKRHREIMFASTKVAASGEGYDVAGDLTLLGRTRPVAARVTREGDRLVTEIRLHQPDFGIKPFSAMFGTLKIQPDVTVRLSVPAA